MVKIGNLNLYVGTKEEYNDALKQDMRVVCALNKCKDYISHQSVVGWVGKGCNPSHPNYLYKETEDAIYLNMIDSPNPHFINDEMIDAALNFIHRNLTTHHKVFIYCSLGESRSPSIALMYLLKYKIDTPISLKSFKEKYYPKFKPSLGNAIYIKNRFY